MGLGVWGFGGFGGFGRFGRFGGFGGLGASRGRRAGTGVDKLAGSWACRAKNLLAPN